MSQYILLIPLLPLASWAIISLANRALSKEVTTWLACGSILASFFLSLSVLIDKIHNPVAENIHFFTWIRTTDFSASFDFLLDPLSSVFLVIITGVGFLIHEYSAGYMHDDDGYRRFFSYLNLFVFFMLMLVMANNFLVMFIGWEGVGLCSYLLIGFWFKNQEYSSAAKKAFIMNRIGDLGLLLGILLIYQTTGSVEYEKVFSPDGLAKFTPGIATSVTLLLFIGAIGKSAQIPLYTWLPDAMAGPTPVSALIHAATMVTAGIYLIARASGLYLLSPLTMDIVMWTGLVTSLLGASIGLYQNDIKKVLAYSTVSQLGLMFAALGVGAFSTGVFHVLTHAFFKALLFLCAGSVIHAMGGEQDIRKMGGLKKSLPITYATFFIATLAISGIPPFAGFFSKDQIISEIYVHKGIGVAAIALIVSLMTCFYMFRVLFVTFFGNFRGTHDQEHHLHESPRSMTIPLIVLAILSTIGGFIGMPKAFNAPNYIEHFLSNSVRVEESTLSSGTEWVLMGGTVALLAVVILYAYNLFVGKNTVPVEDKDMTGVPNLIYNKYFVDDIYNTVITKPVNAVSGFFNTFFETKIVDGLVNGVGKLTNRASSLLRLTQGGNVEGYFFAMVAFIVALLIFKLF